MEPLSFFGTVALLATMVALLGHITANVAALVSGAVIACFTASGIAVFIISSAVNELSIPIWLAVGTLTSVTWIFISMVTPAIVFGDGSTMPQGQEDEQEPEPEPEFQFGDFAYEPVPLYSEPLVPCSCNAELQYWEQFRSHQCTQCGANGKTQPL